MRAIALFSAAVMVTTSVGAQNVIWREDFENGFGQWTGLGFFWNPIAESSTCGQLRAPFPSGTTCARYGNPNACDYESFDVNWGTLETTTPFPLPSLPGTAWLRYWNSLDTEYCFSGGFDLSSVRIVGNSAAVFGYDCNGGFTPAWSWHKSRIELTSLMGQGVRVQFYFDSIDGAWNTTMGWLIDDVSIELEAGRPFCDASAVCPCGNFVPPLPQYPLGGSLPDNVGGCVHSGRRGSELRSDGVPIVSQDNVVLRAVDMPANASVIFLQSRATAAPGVSFGDGQLCLGAPLLRLATRTASNGTASFPVATDPPLSTRGPASTGGGTYLYQAYHRDAQSWCTGATFTLSNGYSIAWVP